MIKYLIAIMMAVLLIFCGVGNAIKWEQMDLEKSIPSGEGIKFSGTAPATTADVLYADGDELMFDGRQVATGAYDVLVKSVSGVGCFAYSQSGKLLASDTVAPYDMGSVYNEAISPYINGNDCKIKVVFDASENGGTMYTNSTLWLYAYIQLDGLNCPNIKTWDNINMMKNNYTGIENRDIVIRNLYLIKRGTGAYTYRHIKLTSPLRCTIDQVSMDGEYTTYSSSSRGGLLLDNAGESYCWENRIINCNMPLLEVWGCTDNWIDRCIFTTRGCGDQNMYIKTNSSIPANNNKISRCHFVCGTSYGINIDSLGANSIWITDCFFEDVGTTSIAGINVVSYLSHATISGNKFIGLDGSGIVFNGKYSNIHDNEFTDCNSLDGGYSDINLVSCHTSRIYANSGTNSVGSSSKGYLVDDNDYNFIWGNIAKGDGYTSHVNAGANTVVSAITNYHYAGAP
jgi:hypothetical protein